MAAPNAKIYVLGYPQLLPEPNICSDPLDAGARVLNEVVRRAHSGDAVALATINYIGSRAGMSQVQIDALILTGRVTFTQSEIAVLTQRLNDKIKQTIVSKNNPRLVFVDANGQNSPFNSHQLCTANSYFNGVDIARPEHSFHPNRKGQDAYMRLILSVM